MREIPGSSIQKTGTVPASRLFEQVDLALTWLCERTKGKAKQGRFPKAQALLKEWTKTQDRMTNEATPDQFKALADCMELVDIHHELMKLDIKYLDQKLTKFALGPVREDEEAESSHEARDTGFELSTLAMLRRSQFDARLTPAEDVFFEIGTTLIANECKRPQSAKSDLTGFRKALRQLRKRRSSRPLGREFMGIAHVDLGKTSHGGRGFLLTRDQSGFSHWTDAQFEDFYHRCASLWKRAENVSSCHLVMVSLTVPVFETRTQMAVVGRAMHVYANESPSSERVMQLLRKRLSHPEVLSSPL